MQILRTCPLQPTARIELILPTDRIELTLAIEKMVLTLATENSPFMQRMEKQPKPIDRMQVGVLVHILHDLVSCAKGPKCFLAVFMYVSLPRRIATISAFSAGWNDLVFW